MNNPPYHAKNCGSHETYTPNLAKSAGQSFFPYMYYNTTEQENGCCRINFSIDVKSPSLNLCL